MTWQKRWQDAVVLATVYYERLSPVGVLGCLLVLAALLEVVAMDLPEWRNHRALQSQAAVLRHKLNQLPIAPEASPLADQDASPLTTKEELPGVLADLSRYAQDNQLRFPEAEYTWTAPTNTSFGQYEVQFELKGGYLPIRHFVEDVENGEPEIAVRELSFARDNANQSDLRSRIRLVIFTKRRSS